MISQADPYQDPVAMVDLDDAYREWSMKMAISEYCHRERSRVRMHQMLNSELKPFGFVVLDVACWRPKR